MTTHFTPLMAPRQARPSLLARLGKRLLVAYWIACLCVIAVGLDRLYPEARATVTEAASDAGLEIPAVAFEPTVDQALFAAPAPRLTRPFRTCAAAHAAGVYDIPAGSPAYSPRQDGDGDGLACEPY